MTHWDVCGLGAAGFVLCLDSVGIKPDIKNGLRVAHGEIKWSKPVACNVYIGGPPRPCCLAVAYYATLLLATRATLEYVAPSAPPCPLLLRMHSPTYMTCSLVQRQPLLTPPPFPIHPPPALPCGCAGATMEIVEMVLGGRVNKSLVSLIQQVGAED